MRRLDILLVLGAAAVVIGLWIGVWLGFPKDTPAAILHYSVGVGIDFIGEGSQIWALPLLATGFLIVNTSLAALIRRSSLSAYWILIGILPLVVLLLALAYGVILRFNL